MLSQELATQKWSSAPARKNSVIKSLRDNHPLLLVDMYITHDCTLKHSIAKH